MPSVSWHLEGRVLIFVMIAFVGGLCVMAGLTGWQEGSADGLEVALNLGLGLLAVAGVAYAFLGRRRKVR